MLTFLSALIFCTFLACFVIFLILLGWLVLPVMSTKIFDCKNTHFHQHVRHKSAFALKFSAGVWRKWMIALKILENDQISQRGVKLEKMVKKVKNV